MCSKTLFLKHLSLLFDICMFDILFLHFSHAMLSGCHHTTHALQSLSHRWKNDNDRKREKSNAKMPTNCIILHKSQITGKMSLCSRPWIWNFNFFPIKIENKSWNAFYMREMIKNCCERSLPSRVCVWVTAWRP